jgi:capsular exopolysaccharide synthesis family protein
MEPAELLRAVRRRWPVVAVTVLVAAVAGWLTTRIVPTGPPVVTFEAQAVLLSDQTTSYPAFSGSGVYNLQTIAALALVGDVPERVAKTIGFAGDPVELTQSVRANGDPETGLLRITATSTDPQQATLLADTFAQELMAFMTERTSVSSRETAEGLKEELDELEEEINSLNSQIGSDPTGDEVLVAQRDVLTSRYAALNSSYQQLTGPTLLTPALTKIQDAVPIPLPEQGFFQVRSWPSRLLLSVVLGLLASIGIVFLLERVDTRIHSREAAERHFDLPVLAEIPYVRRWKLRSGIAVQTDTKSPAADAFRLLAAGVVRRLPTPPQVILVTGPGPAEGKSTVTANLAAAFAEVGKKVLVLSCDLHRPTIHGFFGIPNSKGLTDALRVESDGHSIINGQRWRTPLPNVRLVPSGFVPEKPGELLSSPMMRQVIAEAREVADIVMIDTAPILAASDATHLFPLVDAVLVVGRAGKTTAEAARRTTELLLRLGAPVVGTALNGTARSELPRGYFDYYNGKGRERGRRGRLSSFAGLGREDGL